MSTASPPVTKPPVQGSFRIQHYSKKCFKYDNSDQQIHLSSTCDELYHLTTTKSLVHSATGKCVKPRSNSDNTPVTLTSNCDDDTKFELTSFGSLRQIKTGSCIHPLNGALYPGEGQLVVIYRGCDETRLKFSFGNVFAQYTISRCKGLRSSYPLHMSIDSVNSRSSLIVCNWNGGGSSSQEEGKFKSFRLLLLLVQ